MLLIRSNFMMEEKKIEMANALTHGLGAILFLAASPLLLIFPVVQGDHITAYVNTGYIFCLLITYFSSTVYHATTDVFFKRRMRIMDHISIFLLIGGTFTPLAFKFMEGWIFLLIFWLIILAGIIFKIYFTGKFKFLSTFFYLAIAWVAAMFSGEMFRNMPQDAFWYLITGGIFYSVGTIFYMWKKLTYHHAIWHLFVLGGSIFHFLSVFVSVK